MAINGYDYEDRDRGLFVGNPVVYNTPAPASYASGNQTYLASDIVGSIIVHDGTGGDTGTLPSAALLAAALPGVRVGDTIECLIINGANASGTLSLAAGAGGSFDANQGGGSRIIAFGASKNVNIRFTNVTPGSQAYTVFS